MSSFFKLIILSISLILYNISALFAENDIIDAYSKRKICHEAGGVWRKYGNGCVDHCMNKFSKFKFCTAAITYGCDCGDNSCYYDNKCHNLSDFKREYDILESEKQKKIDVQRKLRESEYINQKNLIIKNLIKNYNIEEDLEGSENSFENQDTSDQSINNEISSNNNVGSFYGSKTISNSNGESEKIYYNRIPQSKNSKYSSVNKQDNQEKSLSDIFRAESKNNTGSNRYKNKIRPKTATSGISSIIPPLFMDRMMNSSNNRSNSNKNSKEEGQKKLPVIPIQ